MMSSISRIKLTNIPTPLQQVTFENQKFFIKRDDLTGIELSGNKVRKLEYLLSQAKKEKAEYIFTCGGEQSNHARATVIAASQLGLKTKLFLWGKAAKSFSGNSFFYKYFNAEIKFLDRKEYENVNEIMTAERNKYVKEGKNVFVIPEGGSTSIGIMGYMDFVDELQKQIDLSRIKGIVLAAGSGGTAAGIIAGFTHKKIKAKVYAVNVLYSKEEIRKKILMLAEACLLENNIMTKINPEQLVVVDGYSKEGYKNITRKKLSLIKKFALETGIILDPAYTGKAFNAYYDLFISQHKCGGNIFLHTGGIWGVMSKSKEYLSIK
ncbi:MAG: pyridoxal-phosphate dependent enzyme [Ignavibacteriales bacterium]|nr:MAG: pyridoxal-phosphate dependent enzyme [Ignavibacteriales bacterium]